MGYFSTFSLTDGPFAWSGGAFLVFVLYYNHKLNKRGTMFQVDDELLNSLGLGALAGPERDAFKDYIKTTLQERVGEKLTEGMSDETLDEFGFFMDGNVEGMKGWLARHVPNYEQDANFQQFRANNPDASEADILSSYGSLAWLQLNRPDYPEVVKQTMDELKSEIAANRDMILAGAKNSA